MFFQRPRILQRRVFKKIFYFFQFRFLLPITFNYRYLLFAHVQPRNRSLFIWLLFKLIKNLEFIRIRLIFFLLFYFAGFVFYATRNSLRRNIKFFILFNGFLFFLVSFDNFRQFKNVPFFQIFFLWRIIYRLHNFEKRHFVFIFFVLIESRGRFHRQLQQPIFKGVFLDLWSNCFSSFKILWVFWNKQLLGFFLGL